MNKKSKVILLPCNSYREEIVYENLEIGLELLGGIENIVGKEESVLLKPNLLKKAEVDKAVITHPTVVGMFARLMREKGYQDMALADSCGNGTTSKVIHGTGMDMYLNDDGVTNYCNWNRTDGDINGIDVAEAMINIAKNPGFLNAGDDEFAEGIKDDSIIAGVSGVWLATSIEEAWGDNYGAVKLPTYTCAGKQVQMSSYAGYKYVGVNSYSDNREWAEKLADWLTNEDSQKERFVQRGLGPSNINASDSSEVKASPAINAIIEQSQYAKLQRIGGNYWEPMERFGEIMASGNPDNKNLQEVMDDLVKKITALIGN